MSRWAVAAGLVLLVVSAGISGAILGHERGVQEGAASAAETAARVQSTEAALAESQTQTASLAAARARVEERLAVAEALVVGAEAERDAVLASVRAPMTPQARARRVAQVLAPTATSSPATSTARVRAIVLDGEPVYAVRPDAFEQMHEALELRPALERQVAALRVGWEAERERGDLAIAELAVVAHERDTLRIAWAAAEGDLAEARADAGLSTEAKVIAGVVVAAVLAGGIAIGRATADGVTVVR